MPFVPLHGVLFLVLAAGDAPSPEALDEERPADAETDVPPPSTMTAAQTRRHRIGGYSLLVGAAAVQATSLAFKGISTTSDIPEAKAVQRGTSDCTQGSACLAGGFVNPLVGLGFVTASALGGGGMHLLGRLRADFDREDGMRWGGARTSMTIGSSLVVGGLVALASTQLAAFGVENLVRRVRLLESGWYMFGILVPAGALALGHGHGYLRHMGISRRDAQIRVVPAFGASTGISIAGRF